MKRSTRIVHYVDKISRDELSRLSDSDPSAYERIVGRCMRLADEPSYQIMSEDSASRLRRAQKLADAFAEFLRMTDNEFSTDNLDGQSAHVTAWGDVEIRLRLRHPIENP